MDSRDYEQIEIPSDAAGESMKWVLPNAEVEVLFVDERPAGVQVPSAVEMTVDRRPSRACKGDTASGGGTKPATLESGVESRCRSSSNEGERVRVDTRSRRVRLARLERDRRARDRDAPIRPAPRRRLRALPARCDRPPARRAPRATPSRSRASWPRAPRRTAPSSTRQIAKHSQAAGRWTGSRRSSARSCGWRCTRSQHSDDVPAEVAIDEAVELAKEYCGADAPGFVNGILGAAARRGREWRAVSDALACRSTERLRRDRGTSSDGEDADDERAAELAREAAELVGRGGRGGRARAARAAAEAREA